MNKFLRSPGLLRRETPEALDRRILLAGAIAASRYRRRSRLKVFGGALTGAAAAVALSVIAVRNLPVPVRTEPGRAAAVQTAKAHAAGAAAGQELSERELLEFTDWTTLEQENYNLASQLNCYQDVQDIGIPSQV